MIRVLLGLLLVLGGLPAQATVRVVTSLPELADITANIGGDRVIVDYIVRGDQNPHFVEVKPSYMMKLKSADLFLLIGMDLEMWAPQIVDGSRNSRLEVIDLSKNIEKQEVPQRVDASQGDVHRFGNPHYWLDPRNVRVMAETIVQALARRAPADETYFRTNATAYVTKLEAKIPEWESRLKPFAGGRIVTFHKSWTYFASWLGLEIAAQIEPKPGIQPSPSHTTEVIRLVREGHIKAIVVEPFYDASAAEQIARTTGARVVRLVTSVGGVEEAKDYISMMEYNTRTLAAALR
jgi:ABC-type Zn uptake system ZnuABC Zn-binding protein ZnuA